MNPEELKLALIRCHMKQKELARLVGVTEATMSRYLTAGQVPKKSIIAKMAVILGTTPEILSGQKKKTKIEFIESYIKIGDADYQWNDNHGELIRCKNCKFSEDCPIAYGKDNDDNWFCADGKKKGW